MFSDGHDVYNLRVIDEWANVYRANSGSSKRELCRLQSRSRVNYEAYVSSRMEHLKSSGYIAPDSTFSILHP